MMMEAADQMMEKSCSCSHDESGSSSFILFLLKAAGKPSAAVNVIVNVHVCVSVHPDPFFVQTTSQRLLLPQEAEL